MNSRIWSPQRPWSSRREPLGSGGDRRGEAGSREACTRHLSGFLLVLVVLLVSGCASRGQVDPAEQLRAAVVETVVDPDRRAEIVLLSDEYLDLVDRIVEELEEGRRTLDGLVADYSSDRDQFDAFFADYVDKRSRVADRAIEIHLAKFPITKQQVDDHTLQHRAVVVESGCLSIQSPSTGLEVAGKFQNLE